MKDKKKIIEIAKNKKIEDANVDEKNDLRNKIIIVVVGIILLVLICFGIKYVLDNPSVELDGLKFKEEYEKLNGTKLNNTDLEYLELSIDEESPIKYSSYEEIFDILDNGSGVIYFGFPECPWCRALTPVLLDAVKEVGIDKVYYLNNKADRDTLEFNDDKEIVVKKEGTEDYYKLVSKLGEFASFYEIDGVETKEKRLYFPTVLVVKDGEILAFHEATLDSQENPFKEMTKEQKKELKDILVEKLEKLIVCDGAC